MASKPSDFSRWGSLTQLGLTEDDLLNIIVRREGGYTPPSYHDPPTYGTIFELHYYSNYIAGNVRRKPNRVLKCLLDTLFPSFSVSRADRLERRVILLNSKVESMSKEELDEYLQQKWIPQATGKALRHSCDVTEELVRHNLQSEDLQQILLNPNQCTWTLASTPSTQFYVDLHHILQVKRVPVNEVGMIYRSIDPALMQSTTDDKHAYKKIQLLINNYSESLPENSDDAHDPQPTVDSPEGECEEKHSRQGHFAVHNVKRREQRARSRIEHLQKSLRSFKQVNKVQEDEVRRLTSALEEFKSLIKEKNKEISNLRAINKCHEQTIDILEDELAHSQKLTDEDQAKHDADIEALESQIKQLQINDLSDKRPQTFSSRTYSTTVRALYYSLLSMRLPPGQIKTVIKNVISYLVPSINTDQLRLPGKSCASYMRSQEMPTISQAQKASKLNAAKEWHLNSDGTTLNQQKKVAFLINGLVLGVRDVSSGSSEVALEALKDELARTHSVLPEFSQEEELQNFNIDRIVSSTSDAASTQTKFTRLLEEETGNEVIENKCSMHLGVNLRVAQVNAVSETTRSYNFADKCESRNLTESDDSAECENSQGNMTMSDAEQSDVSESSHNVSHNNYRDNFDDDEDITVCETSSTCNGLPTAHHSVNYDIDLFVHELAKLFGHLGTPEYCHGVSTFRVFLSHRAKESVGAEREYYECAQKVMLERQVGSRYYVTSCNAGRLYFLRKAMVEFLKEQKLIKTLNRLESTCLEKLQDPVLTKILQLEGLMFDKVYADLMMLVKSTELNKSSLDMNAHYKELLCFFSDLSTNPALLLDSDKPVFESEASLYSDSKELNHRLKNAYIPVRKELYFQDGSCNNSVLFTMVTAASKAMELKLKSYKEDHLPGGRYSDPDDQTSSILAKLKPHNDQTESVFGTNDWLNTIMPNMAQSTRSTLVEFSYNKTMEWLKSQGEEQKRAMIVLAQQRRQQVVQEGKEATRRLFERKLQERINALEKGKEKEKRRDEKLGKIKSESLISTVKELNERVLKITSLSLPKRLQDAEIKTLVQRQVQLRSMVFHQKIRVNVTEKGKQRPTHELLEDLSKIITENPVHVRRKQTINSSSSFGQNLHCLFDKPSLLRGVKLQHQFVVDGELKWFTATIEKVKNKTILIHYHETEELCEFTLDEIRDDFLSGDLIIV